ncbi:MAG: hypothetical protein CL793_06395 [Chloroflexi bacterium]|nr:hypothetical protein [Chloroflexota bacterium]|tara:strand:- start:9503 stop:9718 length:216 start_codon:yes stop_codon:yes gene_type:complete
MSSKKPTKPGWQSTEFWLSLVAVICGAIVAGDVVSETSTVGKAIGAVVSVLGALGYTASRTAVKVNTVRYE